MKQPKILYIMGISWFWVKQRPHFIAEELAKHFTVDVVFPVQFYKPRYLVKNQQPPSYVRAIRIFNFGRFRIIRAINDFLIKRELKRAMKKNDVLWFTRAFEFGLVAGDIPAGATVVYDCMDDFYEFDQIKNHKRDAQLFLECERKLLSRADVVFVSSAYLMNRIKERYGIDREMIVLNNAISDRMFAEKRTPSVSVNGSDYVKGATVDLMYIGTIAEWFDVPLMMASLERFQEIRYILMGPCTIKLPAHERVLYLGVKTHEDLPYYINKADALIMPFIVNELILSVDPVKLYEYIGFGKPVITCGYPEIDKFGEFVHRYENPEQYFSCIRRVIDGDLTQKNIDECMAFLHQNTWQSRIGTVVRRLQQ